MVKPRVVAVALLALVCLALAIVTALRPGKALTFESEVSLEMKPEAAWQKLRDLSLAHHYVPGIQHTEIVSSVPEGVGASRRVYSSSTDYLVETVVEWRPRQGFTLALTEPGGNAPAPFRAARFTYEILDARDGSTRLRTHLAGTLRGGRLGEWLGTALLTDPMQDRVDAVSHGLKLYYEQ